MIEQVIAAYVDHALQVKNNEQLDLNVKTEVMLKMAQALGTLVPLVSSGQDQALEMQRAQQQLAQSQQQHDMTMQMQQDKHLMDMQHQQQKHALQMELNKQKAQEAYKKQSISKSQQNNR